jgi:hypothetical protein
MYRENELAEDVQDAIESFIAPEVASNDLFAPTGSGRSERADTAPIVGSLAAGITDLREVGHNVIFASAALKAFHQIPDAATEARIDGISKLIGRFKKTVAPEIRHQAKIPPIEPYDGFIDFIFRELLTCMKLYRGFGQGWSGHLLTLGHALVELSRIGYKEVAASGQPAFQTYIELLRRGPKECDRRVPDNEPGPLTPLDAAYWQRKEFGIGHKLKYPYSFYALLRDLRSDTFRQKCLTNSYLIF